MPTIESRICFDYNFNMFTRKYEVIAYPEWIPLGVR